MPKHAAYLMLAVIVLALAAVDFMIVTSSAGITRIARAEIGRIFGEDLQFDDLVASLDGTLQFQRVRLRLPGTDVEVIRAEHAEIRMAGGDFRRHAEHVVLHEPRFFFNQRVLDEISRGARGRSLRDLLPPGTLPRVECAGGTVEVQYAPVFQPSPAQEFRIDHLNMVPFAEYSYLVTGRLRHVELGAWSPVGELDIETGAVRLVASTPSLALDAEVRSLLSDEVRSHWDGWKPQGLAAVYVRLDADASAPLHVTATAYPKDLAITYAQFPYRIEHVEGEIDFRKDGWTVKHLRGRRGKSEIRASGVSHGYAADAAYSIRVEADDLVLDPELRAALGEEERRIYDLFSPGGLATVRGRVSRDAGRDAKVRTPVEINFRDGSFQFRDFPYEVRNVEGWIAVSEGTVNVRGMRAHDRGADFRIEGVIRDIARDPDIDVRIEARGLPLDFRLKQALDEKTRALWDDFSPEGALDVMWRVRREAGRQVAHHGTVHSRRKGNKCTYRKVPLMYTDVQGMVEYAPDAVRIHHLSGRAAGADLELHGTILPAGDLALRIDAVGVKVDEPFVRTMPAQVRKILERIRISGEANLRMDLDVREHETSYSLNLKLNRARIDAAIPFEEVQGTVSLSGTIEGEKSEILGHINFARAKIYGKSVSDLLASLNATGPVLRFGSIKASAYGGVVTGTFFVDTETGKYGGEFAADRLDLREFTRETESFREKAIAGKVSLELKEFAGQGEDLSTMRATGHLVIRDGFLWDVPLFVSLWTINPQHVFQRRNQFEAGNVTFDMRDRKFLLRGLAFTSEEVSVVGRGTLHFDGKLDLVLRAESGSLLGIKIPGLDLLLSPLDLLRSSFLGVHVTGTFEKPESGLKVFPGIGGSDK